MEDTGNLVKPPNVLESPWATSLQTHIAVCPTLGAPGLGVTVHGVRQGFPVLYLLLSSCNQTTGGTPVGGTAIIFSGKPRTMKL